jgi:hypothetical protein
VYGTHIHTYTHVHHPFKLIAPLLQMFMHSHTHTHTHTHTHLHHSFELLALLLEVLVHAAGDQLALAADFLSDGDAGLCVCEV